VGVCGRGWEVWCLNYLICAVIRNISKESSLALTSYVCTSSPEVC
jgi:hypothetical protein